MEKIKKKLGISKAEIREGTKDELEHTNVTSKAKKIALDHLKKHPLYYNKKIGLPNMEKKLSKIERSKIKKIKIRKPL
jgi:hypothetical protein